ncbi:MAG: hypothetical protein K6A44_04320 [bacterium]|nr:hypothetical protein [bacterium]
MQVSKINTQNFGATPCSMTKRLLLDLERNAIDTMPIMRIMKNTYVGNRIFTNISSDGKFGVDMFSREGDHLRALIKSEDNMRVDAGTFHLVNPKSFAKKFYEALNLGERTRSKEQRLIDKVYGMFEG